jgi:flagellar basal body-associated protein FliL
MMKNKKLLIPIVLLLVLGGAYKFVLAKPKAAEAKPKVDGTVYVLQKEFLVNLKDGRYAKLTAALLLAHDDTSTAAAGGEGGSSAPEGYGAMTQEAVVRTIITDDLTDAKDVDLIDPRARARMQDKILRDVKKQTDVKVEKVMFPDVTVQ